MGVKGAETFSEVSGREARPAGVSSNQAGSLGPQGKGQHGGEGMSRPHFPCAIEVHWPDPAWGH